MVGSFLDTGRLMTAVHAILPAGADAGTPAPGPGAGGSSWRSS